MSERLTMAQALVRFMAAQHVQRDGARERFFGGCFGIFGHGNVAGIGQALQQHGHELPYYLARNEQAMVHAASGYARERMRLGALACTSSVGPGATNMVTGAALATINRLPVLLLPGDVFASRGPDPVLQQLERFDAGDVSVNDCLRPVSRYWDRITRPEQIVPAALAAMRTLTDPAATGAVTLALPQDVQAEAFDVPAGFLERRTWVIHRAPPAPEAVARAAELIGGAERPLLVAGGGVLYSGASEALARLAERHGIPVAETQAGRGAIAWDHELAAGGLGVMGTRAANRLAAAADVVIGVGTRWTDFATASHSGFRDPGVRFVNVNVCAPDTSKLAGLELVADARLALEALDAALGDGRPESTHADAARREIAAWTAEAGRARAGAEGSPPAQPAIVAAVNDAAGPGDVVVAAAGAMPGDIHKLWRSRRPGDLHLEYGYSCMGYEIAGGLGMKLAAPEREVFVLVGDGSYLMLATEIATAVAEGLKLVIVLVDNSGFASIGSLSRSVGSDGFGTRYQARRDGSLGVDADGPPEPLPVDLGANAASLGAHLLRAQTLDELGSALEQARGHDGTVVIHVPADRYSGLPSCDAWWDVPVAEVSETEPVREARAAYEQACGDVRRHVGPPEGFDG